MMKIGSINPYSFKADTWVKCYEHTVVGSAETSITISGLNGDLDEEYVLESKIVNGYNGLAQAIIWLNSDTGSNYTFQQLGGVNTFVGAGAGTKTYLTNVGYATALAGISQSKFHIFAKSGFPRSVINELANQISGTTVTEIEIDAQSWSNTADNLTTISIVATQTGGLGVGSQIILWKKARKS